VTSRREFIRNSLCKAIRLTGTMFVSRIVLDVVEIGACSRYREGALSLSIGLYLNIRQLSEL